jgi:hypothetical protein
VTGETQVLKNLEINKFYHVREGDDPIAVKLKSFKWPTTA